MEQQRIPVSKQVAEYVQRKPYLLEALEQNIVNYSALARTISKDLSLPNVETVKAALIRTGIKYQHMKRRTQQKAISLLRNAHFSVKNKIATLHTTTYSNLKNVAYSKTPSGYMFFLDETIAHKSTFKKIEYGFAIIHIKSTKDIERTPGAIAFLLSALASEGINISHVMGCREDTFIVINEHDASLAFNVLAQRLRL